MTNRSEEDQITQPCPKCQQQLKRRGWGPHILRKHRLATAPPWPPDLEEHVEQVATSNLSNEAVKEGPPAKAPTAEDYLRGALEAINERLHALRNELSRLDYLQMELDRLTKARQGLQDAVQTIEQESLGDHVDQAPPGPQLPTGPQTAREAVPALRAKMHS